MKPCSYPTQAELLELFDYVEGQLIRKSTGRRASCLHKGMGRHVTKIKGRNLMTARLIWTLLKGDITQDQYVDHIDQNPTNDRIENLRVVSKADNCRNIWKRANKSGYRGVFWKKSHKKWCAESKDKNGKPKFLGYYEDKLQAAEVVQTFLQNEFPHLYQSET